MPMQASHLDYNFREIGIGAKWAPLITVRTAQYDIGLVSSWLFTSSAPSCIGCGLDSRVFRLDPGPGVQWYDVDYQSVIAWLAKIYPTRPRYHLIASSATDQSWLDQIPRTALCCYSPKASACI